MTKMSIACAGVMMVALAGACGDDDGVRPEPDAAVDAGPDAPVATWVLPAHPNRDVDVLFVIDNSGSMAGEQASLAANFPELLAVLRTIEGGLPNLHLGILSSNVGAAGQASVPGCAGQGDDGNLLLKAGCTGVTGQFISDVADGNGGRVKNYTGTMDTLFSCMAQLGTSGCGFEMHLESVFRALQPGKNPSFYRPAAQLAVVILADEDDCSTEMGAMFGDPTAGISSPLGPRTSFRCFEFGVTCQNDPVPRTFGTKTGCRPNPNSQYMYETTKYVDFLRSLKADPSTVMVAAIAGIDDAAHTVVVGPDPSNPANPAVEKSCFIVDPDDPADGAVPPIRLADVVRSFARHSISSICNASLAEAMRDVGGMIKTAIGDPCVRQALRDRDPAAAGLQAECSVVDVVGAGSDDPIETVIPECAPGTAPPCWRIVADQQQCPDVDGFLRIQVDRGGATPPLGTVLEVQCVVE